MAISIVLERQMLGPPGAIGLLKLESNQEGTACKSARATWHVEPANGNVLLHVKPLSTRIRNAALITSGESHSIWSLRTCCSSQHVQPDNKRKFSAKDI